VLADLSNAVLLVVQTDVVSLWSAGRIRGFLDESSGRNRLRLVLNRYKEIPGFTEEDVEKATNSKVLWKIPDSPLVAPAIDRGMPVVRQDNEIGQSFASLARLLAEGEDRAEDGWSPSPGFPSGGAGGSEPPGGSAPPTVSVGVPRPKRPPTLPPRKMGQGA
jgi:septum formation inhibitor-activating ATPase MinD